MSYDFKKIEKKWQKKWEKGGLYEVKEDPKKDKFYCLIEFPYPSGEGLHVGHPRSYTALDIVARKRRMQGYNVLYPIGWDAFGLPAENYAIKTGIHPSVATAKNIKTFTRQLKSLGLSFDWSREINTTDPLYYKWTQWMFLQFFKHGLAYKDKIAINWCTKCKIGLANEEVVAGKCERCGGPVEKRMKEQWMLGITKYAERLIDDLKKVDYTSQIKEQQINWIGKSEGAEVDFKIVIASPDTAIGINSAKQSRNKGIAASPSAPRNDVIKVFTTRPDTLFGATYMVLAPEHEFVASLLKLKSQKSPPGADAPLAQKIQNLKEVEEYVRKAKGKSDLERQEVKDKTGVELKGVKAINPVNNEEIPIWVADYVLTGYGTGAIMAVPAHDERDFEFAKKFGLDVIQVVKKKDAPIKSYLMGAGEISDGELKELGIKIIEKTKENSRKIIIPEDKLKEYEKLIEAKLTPGFWNEYLGKETVFIFKFKDGKIKRLVLNRQNAEMIDKLAASFIGDTWKKSSVWKWLAENDWYIDLIIFSGDGVNINSDFLDGLSTAEAKEKITKWLEEKKIGKKAVNYKLRDWVFSRQRYWGEPIPLVHCEQCAKKKQKVLMIHGFEGSGEGNWLPWLKKELEARGFEVFNPTISTSEHPTIESWIKELLPFTEKMGEEDIIIGHSLGSKAALHLVEKARRNIGHLFLIASAIGSLEERDWSWFKKEWKDSDIDALRKFWEAPVKWEIVDRLVGSKNLVLSDDDPYVKEETHKNLPAGWFYQLWSGFGHFDLKKSPEILGLVLTAKNTGWVPVPEKDLPVELPKVKKYEPTETGESPLAAMTKWVTAKCPKCGGPAKRETDTMPNWAGSSWYFLRYTDPKNKKEFASGKNLKYWMTACPAGQNKCDKVGGVNWYNGGMEHTTLHLLYSRFWYKFLYDIGVIPKECGDEPYKKRTSHGLILGEGGEKMSKSRGNVVNPDDVVEKFGADTMRVYEMFMGPFEQAIPWDGKGVVGVYRFMERVWRLQDKVKTQNSKLKTESQNSPPKADAPMAQKLERLLHQTIKKVGEDIEQMKFNTAVSALMILVNEMAAQENLLITHYSLLITLLAPFAPHLADELWEKSGGKKSIHLENWPVHDPALIVEEEIDLIVQVNGKMRDSIKVKAGIAEEEAKKIVLESEKVKKWVGEKTIRKIIFVRGRLVNIVV